MITLLYSPIIVIVMNYSGCGERITISTTIAALADIVPNFSVFFFLGGWLFYFGLLLLTTEESLQMERFMFVLRWPLAALKNPTLKYAVTLNWVSAFLYFFFFFFYSLLSPPRLLPLPNFKRKCYAPLQEMCEVETIQSSSQ